MNQQQKNQSPNRTTILNQQTTVLQNINDEQSFAGLKDSLISFQYRLKTLEYQVNSKMQREQCFTLLERKSNVSYVKKNFQQLYSKIESDRLKEEACFQRLQEQQKQKISELKKKLKQINNTRQVQQIAINLTKDNSISNFTDSISKKINKVLVKPQQLYLQSNETMFSMLIDQIKQLKQKNLLIQRLIESKHKKTVSLNNEVCRKLQFLQSQLQQTIKFIDSLNYKNNEGSEKLLDSKKPSKKSSTKISQKPLNLTQKINTNNSQIQAYESIRLQLLSKSIDSIQKQLSQKINIKDIVPLIKQNSTSFQQSFSDIKCYIEQNFESMRKILSNQSQINQEISKANRLAWWHCYQKIQAQQSESSSRNGSAGYILFSKQIMNIIPQCLIVDQGQQHTLKVMSKGWYLFDFYGICMQNQENQMNTERKDEIVWIQINNGVREAVDHNKLLNLASDTQIRLITKKQDLFVRVLKI